MATSAADRAATEARIQAQFANTGIPGMGAVKDQALAKARAGWANEDAATAYNAAPTSSSILGGSNKFANQGMTANPATAGHNVDTDPYTAYGDKPADIKYQNVYDPLSMNQASPLSADLNNINMDTRGLDKYRNEALRTGPSAWAGLATAQQGQLAQQGREGAAASAAGQASNARSSLAMHGGLSSGASERIARDTGRNYMDMSNDVGRTAANNISQIGMNDEENRMNQLGQLPGMELSALQPQFQKATMLGMARNQDTTNTMNDNLNLNNFRQARYNKQMEAWGAGKTADAQSQASSGGGTYICTELHKRGLLPESELDELHNFMMKILWRRADFFDWYFKNGPLLVSAAKDATYRWGEVANNFTGDVLSQIRLGNDQAACEAYVEACRKVNAHLGNPVENFPRAAYKFSWLRTLIHIPGMILRGGAYIWKRQDLSLLMRRA